MRLEHRPLLVKQKLIRLRPNISTASQEAEATSYRVQRLVLYLTEIACVVQAKLICIELPCIPYVSVDNGLFTSTKRCLMASCDDSPCVNVL